MRSLIVLLLLGAAISPLACSSTDPFRKATVPDPGPTALDSAQFEDVPVPRGFVLDGSRSFSQRSGDLRLGQFVYHGTSLTPSEALRWYGTEMPRAIYGWSPSGTGEDGTLRFRKGRDEARVRAMPSADRTRLTVDVNYQGDA